MRDKQKHQLNNSSSTPERPIEDSASSSLNSSGSIRSDLLSGQLQSKQPTSTPLVDEGVFKSAGEAGKSAAAAPATPATELAATRRFSSRVIGLLATTVLLLLAVIGLFIAYNAYRKSFQDIQKSRVTTNIDTTSVDLAGIDSTSTGIQGIGVLQVNGDATITGGITANTFNGSGADLTNLNATNITSGTLSDARLSGNVALLDATQTFTGDNTFAGNNTYSATNNFTGNLSLPGVITINANVYNFPAAQGVGALTNDGAGNLVWTNSIACTTCITTGGNSFGAAISIGTNDNFNLTFRTNGVTRLTFDTAGDATFTGTINGNGSGLTNLNASSVSSGTLDDARLSANVALLNTSQIFSGNKTFIGNLTLPGAITINANPYNFPAAQATGMLTNDGAGNLVWTNSIACITCITTGGNSFGAAISIGTNDNFNLTFRTNGITRLTFDTTGNATFTGAIIGDGTQLTGVAKLNSANVFTASNTFVNGITTNSITPTGTLTVGISSQAFQLVGTASSTLVANNGGSSTTVGFIAPSANRNIDFPNESGTICTTGSVCAGYAPASGANYISLQNTTPGVQQAGNANISGTMIAGFFSGSGASITSLDAGNISNGTLSDSRLSTNVALLNTNQTFSGNQTFTGGVTLPGSVTINANSYNFPAAQAGGTLTNDGAGNLSWVPVPSCSTCITSGGNSFGAAISIGTNDNFGLTLRTNGITRLSFDTTGNANFSGPIDATTAIKLGGNNINTAGTLSNVAYLNQANVFTTTNTFSTGIVTNSITPTGTLTIGADSQAFTLKGTSASTIIGVSGANSTTLGFIAPTANNNINLPNESGTVCTSAASSTSICTNFAPAGGSSSYLNLQALSPGTQQTGNANISGTMIAGLFSGSGASITSLDAGNISNGTLSDSRLSGNVTLQGNSFNAAFKLVQLDGSNALPAVGGALLTSLNASNISSGTLDDARLSANVAKLNANQTFSANNTFTGALTLPGAITVNSNLYNFPAVQASGVLTNDGAGNLTWSTSSACPTCITNGGNSFGAAIAIGTNNNFGLTLRTNSVTRLTFDTTGNATFTGAIIGDGSQLSGVAKTATSNTFAAANSFTSAGTALTVDNNATISGTATIGTVSTNTITSTGAMSITPSGAMTIGATSQNFTLQGGSGSTITATGSGVGNTGTTTLSFTGSSVNAVNYTLDRNAAAGTWQICTNAGNCAAVGGGDVTTAGGTAGKLAKFSGAYGITDSLVSESGSVVSVDGSLRVLSAAPDYLQISSTSLTIYDSGAGTTTNYALPAAGNNNYQICTSAGNCGGGGSGANAFLSNLSSVAINTSLLPGLVGPIDLGSNTKPFGDLYIYGSSLTPASQNFKLTGTATGARTITFPDESGTVCTTGSICSGYASNSLSNLSSVAINADLKPGTAGATSLGATAKPFANLYLAGSSLDPTNDYFQLTGTPTGGMRTITIPNASGTICLENASSCGFAASSGSGNYIQNQTAVTQTAGFKITGTGTVATLNATSAIQLGGVDINTGGTLSNVAYLNQANTFSAAGTALTVNNNATISGTLTSGAINGQTISSSANFTGTMNVAGASLSIGTASSQTGSIIFKNNSNANTTTLSLITPTGNRAINLPNEDGTICTTGSVCSGYAPSGSYANTSLSNLGTTSINANLNFTSNPGDPSKTIDGPGSTGFVVTNDSGPLTISTTTSGTLALSSAGTLSISGNNVDSTWGIGTGALSLVSKHFNLTGGTIDLGSSTATGSINIISSGGLQTTLATSTAGSNKTITFPNETGTVCTTASVCSGYAPSSGGNNYIQNQISSTQTAGFKISGTGTVDTLDAVSAILLNGANINTGGTLSNIAYKDQANSFSAANSFTSAGTALTVTNTASIGTVATNTITPSSSLTIGASAQQFTLQGSASSSITATNGGNTTTLSFITPTDDRAISLPNESGTICTTGSVCSGYAPSGSYANTQLSNLGSTAINADLNFATSASRTITGPGNEGSNSLTITNDGPLSLTTTSSANIALTSAGALNLTGAAASSWGIGANALSIASSNFNVSSGSLGIGSSLATGTIDMFRGGFKTQLQTDALLDANRTIVLPNEGGTVCLQGKASCGFATGSGAAFVQNGNSFGATAYLGTTDDNDLVIRTGSGTNAAQTRFTFDKAASTLTGNGATSLVGGSTLTLNAAAASDLNLGSSATTGNIYIGTSTTTGAITIGGAAQNGVGIITLGQSTASNTINIGNANTSTGNTQTINIGAGTPAGTGKAVVTIGNTGGASSLALNAGSGGISLTGATSINTTGTANTTIGNATGTFQLDSSALDISTVGAITGATGITSSGTINFSGLTASRAIFTDASNNLVSSAASSVLANSITDETGSGALVFATAPTVTTLTVSSGGIAVTGNSTIAGTLTSLTGLTSSGTIQFSNLTPNGFVKTSGGNGTLSVSSTVALATDVSGTLLVANGGTGTSTAFTQGSVVFAGASGTYSQNNTNFFWDNTNNRLGIGTASPATTLQVVNSTASAAVSIASFVGSNANTRIAISDDNGVSSATFGSIGAGNAYMYSGLGKYSAIWAGGAEHMRVTAGGNVGIGTTSPGAKLEINQTATVTTAAILGLITSNSVVTLDGLNPTTYATVYGSQFNPFSLNPVRLGQTVTDAATLSIAGVPYKQAGSPIMGFTNTYGLKINTSTTASANSYGLYVDAPTGAANNYAAVFASGNVGIGTATPAQTLVVSGTAAFTDNIQTGASAQDNDTWSASTINLGDYGSIGTQGSFGTTVSWNYTRLASSNTYVGLGVNTLTSAGTIHMDALGITFGYQTTAPTTALPTSRVRLNTAGELLTGGTTDNGAFNLQSNGTGVWGAGAYVNGSDARIKDDIAPIGDSLGTVMKLKPVTFRYKASWATDQSIQPGFIAQDLIAALDGVDYVDGVVKQGDEYMSVAYQTLIPVLTKGLQELNTKVDTMQSGLPTSVLQAIADANAITINGTLTINGITIFNGNTKFNGNVTYNSDYAGTATIPAGQTSVVVNYSKTMPKAPQATATPKDFITGSFRITSETTTGFTIELQSAQAADTIFNWQATMTE